MKLTYLDTSNFILISQEKQNNPLRFNEFLTKWRENENILALSQTHLIELLQAKFQNTRIAHFNLLKDFLPFNYESENFFEREVMLTLSNKGFLIFQEQDTETSIKIFSKEIKSQNELSLIYDSTNIISRVGFYKGFSKANKLSWKAKSGDTFHKTPKPRFSGIENNWLGKIGKILFAKFIGIDLKDKKNQNKSIELLLEDFLFKTQVKSTLKSKFGTLEESNIQTILSNIQIQNCKGLWLRKEVEKNLKRANDFDHKNENDLNNIQYLPYVDVFLTDKRIVESTQQVLRRKDVLESLKSVSIPRKASNTIESLEEILFQQN
ncbi:MAG: hypothetical protein WA584_02640 [Pyrinomonadaceae bacterium]